MKVRFDGKARNIGNRELKEIVTPVIDSLAAVATLTRELRQDEIERTLRERRQYEATKEHIVYHENRWDTHRVRHIIAQTVGDKLPDEVQSRIKMDFTEEVYVPHGASNEVGELQSPGHHGG
jgi:hypothetical protein